MWHPALIQVIQLVRGAACCLMKVACGRYCTCLLLFVQVFLRWLKLPNSTGWITGLLDISKWWMILEDGCLRSSGDKSKKKKEHLLYEVVGNTFRMRLCKIKHSSIVLIAWFSFYYYYYLRIIVFIFFSKIPIWRWCIEAHFFAH